MGDGWGVRRKGELLPIVEKAMVQPQPSPPIKGDEMKTEIEIKNKIKLLQGLIKNVKPLPKHYRDLSKARIRALKWVLGYKLPKYYYCIDCDTVHVKLKCPKCGNAISMGIIEKYFSDNKTT